LAPKSVTLTDIERRNDRRRAISEVADGRFFVLVNKDFENDPLGPCPTSNMTCGDAPGAQPLVCKHHSSRPTNPHRHWLPTVTFTRTNVVTPCLANERKFSVTKDLFIWF